MALGGHYYRRPTNGGLFSIVDPVDLVSDEIKLLLEATKEDWSKVNPAIFGTLFQSSMDAEERHALGAHFTSEADIQKVVGPTIIRPFRKRIEDADTLRELESIRTELLSYRVLDPSCGSGNFLYVAYRELKRVESDLIQKIHSNFRSAKAARQSLITARQFFGIDIDDYSIELAKVTLMLAKELALAETRATLDTAQVSLPMRMEAPLPLEDLSGNFQCDDALFCEWPRVDAIIGNPPYQSKNKIQGEFEPGYIQRVRGKYPEVPGRADYCVYWFRRAQDELPEGGRAGLVGTNTIRQNYSRQGGLDHIVASGGVISEAVSTQVWSGDAEVHVSIVNWVKGDVPGRKPLYFQRGDHVDSPWEKYELETIGPSLTERLEVSSAPALRANQLPKKCFQGQTHGNEAFLLSQDDARELIEENASYRDVLHPYMIANDLVGKVPPGPSRWAIDFHELSIQEASKYKDLFGRIQKVVLPERREAAEREADRNVKIRRLNSRARINRHHAGFYARWWQFDYPREDLISNIEALPRYIICGRHTRRPIFEFVDHEIRPNDALTVFPLADDYSFGILQSDLHWEWFTARCSTIKGDPRYTSETVFDSFPWPQDVSRRDLSSVAKAAAELRELRIDLVMRNGLSLRELYRQLELPGKNVLRDAHEALDNAVRKAYGVRAKSDALTYLFALNSELARREAASEPIVPPGCPPGLGVQAVVSKSRIVWSGGWA